MVDDDHKQRVAQLKEQVQKEKEQIAKLEQAKKDKEYEYEEAMKQLNKVDGEYRSLRDQAIMQNKAPKKEDEEFEEDSEMNSIIQKNKVLARIAENKVGQLKCKIQSQKRKNDEIDKEIAEIREKLSGNEELSKRAKDLKNMLINKKQSIPGKPSSPPEMPTSIVSGANEL